MILKDAKAATTHFNIGIIYIIDIIIKYFVLKILFNNF